VPKGRNSGRNSGRNGGHIMTGPADPVTRFFAALGKPGHLAIFEGDTASVRLDVLDGKKVERWHVSIAQGDVAVTRGGGPADAIIRVERRYLEAMVTGRLNAQAAFLRGLFACEGSVGALMMFQRCLPGPPGATGRVAPISSKTVMAERGIR